MVDWSAVDVEVAKTILRQAELHLDGQSRMAVAADQRALSVASAFSGFAGVVVTATFGFWAQAPAPALDLLVAGLFTAALMLVGAFSCMLSALPVSFALTGSQPEQWWPVSNQPLNIVIGGETENYQQLIDFNHSILVKNARLFKIGLAVGLSAPLAGSFMWFAVRAIGSCIQSCLT